MNKFLKKMFSRMMIVGALIAVQVLLLIAIIWRLNSYFVYWYAFFMVLSIVVVLHLLIKDENPSFKLSWTIPILLFPVFGGVLYLLFGSTKASTSFIRSMDKSLAGTEHLMEQNPRVDEKLQAIDNHVAMQSRYIADHAGFPLYEETTTEYLSPGEVKFERLKEELRKAKHYIFLEYFIIEEGIMWNAILDILVQKVKEGVDVRVMYDDIGSLNTLPYRYYEKLERLGIKAGVFNPFRPVMSVKLNHRDHRKIVVIDGYVGFTGGINLADEYINVIVKHGHWKDASIMLKGKAVWNLTVMFIRAWNFVRPDQAVSEFDRYRPEVYHPQPFESDGFVQPYGDSPMDGEAVGENAYLNMIGKAQRYLYINTPYLIVDNEMVTALSLAAKSGVDVRIVTPHIPDSWYVHMMTRSYYAALLRAGVKIYEYTPGFIHSKTFVCDDEVSIIGTINLDYRSLYLHFECGVWLYRSTAVMQLKEDFLKTLSVCEPMTLEKCEKQSLFKKLVCAVLRVFAPLM